MGLYQNDIRFFVPYPVSDEPGNTEKEPRSSLSLTRVGYALNASCMSCKNDTDPHKLTDSDTSIGGKVL